MPTSSGDCPVMLRAHFCLLFSPSSTIDGPAAVQEHEKQDGKSYIRSIQKLTDVHLHRVSLICEMSDSDFILLEDSACSPPRRLELIKIRHETQISINMLDKPNLHRLRELVYTTLPMVGHISGIGELVLKNPSDSEEGYQAE